MGRGSISKATFQKLQKQNSQKFATLRKTKTDVIEVEHGDIKFGMDIEIHEKKKKNYSIEREEQAMDWIESVTKEEINDFHEDLKNGLVLCKLINTLYPNIIPKVGTRDVPLVHRDNIGLYLSACTRVGIPTSQGFTISDL